MADVEPEHAPQEGDGPPNAPQEAGEQANPLGVLDLRVYHTPIQLMRQLDLLLKEHPGDVLLPVFIRAFDLMIRKSREPPRNFEVRLTTPAGFVSMTAWRGYFFLLCANIRGRVRYVDALIAFNKLKKSIFDARGTLQIADDVLTNFVEGILDLADPSGTSCLHATRRQRTSRNMASQIPEAVRTHYIHNEHGVAFPFRDEQINRMTPDELRDELTRCGFTYRFEHEDAKNLLYFIWRCCERHETTGHAMLAILFDRSKLTDYAARPPQELANMLEGGIPQMRKPLTDNDAKVVIIEWVLQQNPHDTGAPTAIPLDAQTRYVHIPDCEPINYSWEEIGDWTEQQRVDKLQAWRFSEVLDGQDAINALNFIRRYCVRDILTGYVRLAISCNFPDFDPSFHRDLPQLRALLTHVLFEVEPPRTSAKVIKRLQWVGGQDPRTRR